MDTRTILRYINSKPKPELSEFEQNLKDFEFVEFLNETARDNARGFKVVFGDNLDKECICS